MKSNAELRRQARTYLRGNWGMMVLCTLLVGLASYMLMMPVALGSAVATLASGVQTMANSVILNVWQILVSLAILPASWMLTVMCLRIIRGEHEERHVRIGEVIEGYRYTNRVIFTNVLLAAIMMALVVIYVMAMVLVVEGLESLTLANSEVVETVILAFLIVIFLTLMIFVVLRLSLVEFLIWDTDLGAFGILRESNRMMKGRCWKMLGLSLSFIGWALLAVLTLFVGFLWLQPYINASVAAFYDNIREEEAEAAAQQAAADVELIENNETLV